jgi:putative drug exporter of the RND superfamily
VLLVSLGADYNLFVVGRIWQESQRRPLKDAIGIAAPRASRAVTIAGLTLALSFALLAIVPLAAFREFAFIMGVGALIDTFLVRTFLVPGLISLVGPVSWWPGIPREARSTPR